MSVRIEKNGPIWTVIHSRAEARNAMDPKSAEALFEAFQSFDVDLSLIHILTLPTILLV